MKKLSPPGRSNAGFTILEILAAVALLGIGSSIFIQYNKTILANRGAAELIRQRTIIKTMLINSTSCEKIDSCVDKELREIKDSTGRVLVKNDGTSTYGPWQVEARCQPDLSLKISVTSSTNGVNRLDPLTKKPLDINHIHSTLLQPGALCGPIEKKPISMQVYTVRSALCTRTFGSCPPPAEYPNQSDRMCCEDGRDVVKPQCNAGNQVMGAYWDRQGSWGMDGSWVVLCQ